MTVDATSVPNAADHRLPLSGGDWALWRHAGLRGAGFPASWVLRLGFPECAEAAGRLLEAEGRADEAWGVARDEVTAALSDLHWDGEWEDEERARELRRALRAIKKGNLTEAVERGVSTARLDALRTATGQVAEARDAYESAHAATLVSQSERIHEVAGDPRFQEAVVLQNRQVFHSGIGPLLRKPARPGSHNAGRRELEEMVASYLQRYAVKNDTIGFFGPMAWVRLTEDGPPVEVRPGPGLVARRETFLEAWCFQAVAEALGGQKAVKPWLVPRLLPSVHLDGGAVRLASGESETLSAAEELVLARCDGTRTAQEIAGELAGRAVSDLAGEGEVYALLGRFQDRRWIHWSLYAPTSPHARDVLELQIGRIGEPKIEKVARVSLEALERCREAVDRASGDVEALDRSLEKLEAVFEKLTGEAATRDPGRIYAGRTLVYQDSLRDLDARIGPEVLRALDGPLALILQIARWYTDRIARGTRDLCRRVYHELAGPDGIVDGLRFWHRVRPLFLSGDVEHMGEARTTALERWLQILDPRPGQRRLELSSADLRERVEEAFACPTPGWQLARHHSPDVMVVARGLDALRRGEFQLVLGEVHVGFNTLNSWALMALHPARDEVFRAIDLDLPEPGPRLQAPADLPGLTTRTQIAHVSEHDFLVPPPDEPVIEGGERVLRLSEMVIEESGGDLVVRTRDGRHRFPITEFLSTHLSHHATKHFGLLPRQAHVPRVTIDRMVVLRESWRFLPEEVPFRDLKEPSDRYLEAQRWARSHGIPRFVFVKAPVEHKPFYVDFTSPVYVDLLARVVRRCVAADLGDSGIRVSEMVPGPDELWLPDADGELYTCELRVVAVDRLTPEGNRV